MHNRQVEKHVGRAEKAAADLGVAFDAHSVRKALAFRWAPYLLRLRRVLIAFVVLGVTAVVTYRPACRPGGILDVGPVSCGSYSAYVLGPGGDPRATGAFVCISMVLVFVWSLWRAEHIARCYEPLYPLLSLLSASGDLVGMAESHYTDAGRLRKRVRRVGLPLREVAGDAASAFGAGRAIRKELVSHGRLVDTAFTQAADELMRDREGAARKLGLLAATAASSIAADRFQEMLPEALLPSEGSGEGSLAPDRVDGLRLAKACAWSALCVTLFSLLLAWLGVPAELMVPLAILAFPVAVYVLLAARHGLNEASRLTRSISTFFSSGPPL
ncbi:hypothetical protein [Streptomyces sp. NPDC056358]|uniref:hypothetical protein n=1 Tax=Streptomyces sp. NPDC056358 TaxID=3345794 RepID=UPI0035DEE9E4